ncbi:hypothetical protein [Streptomyces sp. AC512_CC834]|uniref:hypothetical protein n=1 Tax=Streptomyces sp. AC512_CC834 TaxID=2823691 RepID=UPI001C268CB7|nr:hypothetical protein [Streptomyces sp. AC512_CC834]
MVKRTAVVRRTAGRWRLAALTASAVLASGCAGPVDPDELPGTYRNEETGGEVVLGSDGTFSATHISMDESPGTADFSGTWDFVDSETRTDFVYLSVEDGGLGMTAGVQLYTGAEGKVYFHPDPDGPHGLVLTRTTAP